MGHLSLHILWLTLPTHNLNVVTTRVWVEGLFLGDLKKMIERDFPARFHWGTKQWQAFSGSALLVLSQAITEVAAAAEMQTSCGGLKRGQNFLEKGMGGSGSYCMLTTSTFQHFFLLHWPLLGILCRRQAPLRMSVVCCWFSSWNEVKDADKAFS